MDPSLATKKADEENKFVAPSTTRMVRFPLFSSKLSIPSILPFVVVALVVFVATSAVTSSVIFYYAKESGVQTIKSFCHSDRNNLFGDLFSSSLFLVIICLLNFNTFNRESFCLMNPLEMMCDPYRESLSCHHTNNFNIETEMGNYFDGFAGFFRNMVILRQICDRCDANKSATPLPVWHLHGDLGHRRAAECR